MLFFRQLQHLLPRGAAWSTTIDKTLRRFFLGLSEQPQATKDFVDQVYLDLFPETTRELNEWERQFGLTLSDPTLPDSDPAIIAARLALAAEWRATGGQSPSYIQGVLRTAGYDVYVHDWWSSGPPYVARDPRDYTEQPQVGSFQCTGQEFRYASQPQCSNLSSQPQCNDWLANEVYYLVNKDLTRRAPPPVPSDPNTFPYWFYIGGETFGDHATVDITRRAEFERLVLKLRPLHLWVGVLVDFEAVGFFELEDGSDFFTTEGGDPFIAES